MVIFNKALKWTQTYRGLPFFLFIHTYEIHAPYSPPGRFATMFDSDYDGPVGTSVEMCYPKAEGFSDADKIHVEALYDGAIAYTDEVVGKFLNGLRQIGLLDKTVVIILSDHGEEFYEHGDVEHWKTLYDEVLRVPLIIKLAGRNPPVGRVRRQVSLTDVYATIAEILGIEHAPPPDCMSLCPLMGPPESPKRYDREVIVSDLNEVDEERAADDPTKVWSRMRSVRTDDEKYITSEKKQMEELYDLRADPGEQNNIAHENTPRLLQHRARLASFFDSVVAGRTPPSPDERKTPLLTEDDKRRMKALGYNR